MSRDMDQLHYLSRENEPEPEHKCLTCHHRDWEHMRGGLCTAYGCECREWTPDDGMEVAK